LLSPIVAARALLWFVVIDFDFGRERWFLWTRKDADGSHDHAIMSRQPARSLFLGFLQRGATERDHFHRNSFRLGVPQIEAYPTIVDPRLNPPPWGNWRGCRRGMKSGSRQCLGCSAGRLRPLL